MSNGICVLSCGSKPTFFRIAGKPDAALPTSDGMDCAVAAIEAPRSVKSIVVKRTFILLLSSFLGGRDGRETLFGNNLHRVLHRNLCNAGVLIDPAGFFVGFRIAADFFTQIG